MSPMNADVSLIARDEKDRQKMLLPNRATIDSVITSTEQAQIESLNNVGTQKTVLRHPFMSINSWIRVMPEAGTTCMTQLRGDVPQLEMWGYIQNSLPNRLVRNRNAGTGIKPYLFRELYEGELEFMSKGRAYVHFSDGGDLDLRGGTIHTEMLQTDLRHRTQAPTHDRTLHLWEPDQLALQESFGVVRRPDQTNPALVSTFIRRSDQTFAVEYSRWLNKANGDPLVEQQEGHVYGQDGTEVKQASTNKPMRSYKRYYNDQKQALSVEIDEQLNILVVSTNTSKETKLQLGAQNVLDITAKQLKASFLTTGQLAFTNSVELRSAAIHQTAPNITLGGKAAVSPAVLGDKLISSSLSPAMATIATAFTTLSASPPIAAETATANALKAAATTINSLAGNLSAALSAIVKIQG